MAITVRQATTADAEVISALNAAVQAVHAAAVPDRFKPPGQDTLPASQARMLLERPDNLIFLAYMDQEAAGYAYAEIIRRPETSLTHPYESVYLHHISVENKFRRAGVGSALLSAMRKSARDLQIALLTLDVWSFNDGARAFFRRHGFDPYIERLWCRQPEARSE